MAGSIVDVRRRILHAPLNGECVHVFVGDIHFGKGDPASERIKERALVAALESLADRCEHLVLLGDVFDYYIEYRHLVPRGYTRFLGLLARLSDSGCLITYVAGNHDPWHKDYFQSEFGAELVVDGTAMSIAGKPTYVHHGDGIASKSRFYNRIRGLLRHPVPVWVYKNAIPGDLGAGLARHVSRTYGDEGVDPGVAEDLRGHAFEILSIHDFDQVIFGHAHIAEITTTEDGVYMNPGSWHESNTILVVESDGPTLLQWNGSMHVAYESA
jgi:UDP-2,3-diacylglucosamine hydrolase